MLELSAEHPTRSAEPRGNGALRATESFGDLRIAEALDVSQDDDHAGNRRKAEEGLVHLSTNLLPENVVFDGRRRSVGHLPLHWIRDLVRSAPASLAEPEEHIYRHAIEPGGESGGSLELAKAGCYASKYFLRKVFGCLSACAHTKCEPVRARVVSEVDLRKRLPIAAEKPRNEILVGHVCHRFGRALFDHVSELDTRAHTFLPRKSEKTGSASSSRVSNVGMGHTLDRRLETTHLRRRMLPLAVAGWLVVGCAAVGSRAACPRPSARANHSMVFDTAEHRLVLFGGVDKRNRFLNDLWSWDGSNWNRIGSGGPEPRIDAAMVYDGRRERIVLFGGQNFPTVYGDTWEWDGKSWAEATTSGPGPRAHTAMAYDEARGVVVLFGGFDPEAQHHVGDTWEWDGSSWTRRDVAGPSPRGAHAMGFDTKRGVVLLYGGLLDSGLASRETWAWDGRAWTLLSSAGPVDLPGRVLTSLGPKGDVLLFGGRNGSSFVGGTWVWNGESWNELAIDGPPARGEHAIAYDSDRDAAVIFGGTKRSGKAIRDLWQFSDGSWTKRAPCGG